MPRLTRTFFARPTPLVARELLGKVLVHILADGTRLSGRIVETEAYRPDDQASHSFRGPTPRTAPMFGPPGVAYVYFTYGMHYCFNVSTEAEAIGAAVLIRALEPLEGVQVMEQFRRASLRQDKPLRPADVARGPGNVCKAMSIGREHSGYDMPQRNSPLFIADDGFRPALIRTSARVGVSGDELAKSVPWRFYIQNHPAVSGRRRRAE